MKLKNRSFFWISALLVAISFDRLFWEQSFGLNFFLFVLLTTLGGLIPIWLENISVPWTSYLLVIPIGFFSAMTFLRAEPFTTAMNVLITMAALVLFLITLRNGAWYRFRLQDYLVNGSRFVMNGFIGGILFFNKTGKEETSNPNKDHLAQEQKEEESLGAPEAEKERHFLKSFAPYLRGILLALPILALLAFLLAQADPIFNDRIQSLFSGFRLENLGETLARFIYILVIAYALLSSYYFAFAESKKFDPKKDNNPLISPFLGSIESSMVLGGVNLLFLLFVILQFSYLFNGGKNISVEGYTYAEYARRGFFELIAVAVISLVLFYILSLITKRERRTQQRLFSGLGLTLVGLVGIILVSAYTRLNLYEMAYGFTRLRTLAHVFMIWIGLLLVGVAVLEISRKITRLALILVCFIFGFGITINAINIDRFIVQQNVTRALRMAKDTAEGELDSGYLSTLSADAVPILVDFFTNSGTPETLENEIGGVLACQSATLEDDRSWVSYHYARSQAVQLLENQSAELEDYPLSYDMYTWFVEVNGEVRSCSGSGYD